MPGRLGQVLRGFYSGRNALHERIYVLSGKSLKIKHNLLSQNVQDKQ